MNQLTISNIKGVRARLDENGNPELNLEDVAKGLGFTQFKNDVQYVRWETIAAYLWEFGFSQQVGKETFIKESLFYKLCFKAKNEIALNFQNKVTEEILPQIRKSGMYVMAPKTYAEALRAIANEVEAKELMEKQRDEAILTKAWIGDKKTATAMNTASQKSKELKKLQNQLDKSKTFASIKAVEIATKNKFDWRLLRNYCNSHELEMRRAFDANYGSVRTYPAEAWFDIYEVDLQKLF